MSDEEAVPVEGEGEDAPAKKKPPLLVIIAAAVVLVLALGGVGTFLMLGKTPPAEAGHEPEGSSFEYGPHKDNNDENAQRAAALAKAAAEGGTPHAATPEAAPAPEPAPPAPAPAAKAGKKAHH